MLSSNMFSEKIEQLINILEKQEMDAPNGIVSAQLYSELFAAYLFKGDLCSARFLWKRIPPITKNGNIELEKIWKIYNTLWNNNVEHFFKNINYEWSTNVAELMFELKEKILQETINLIGLAYSSIFEDCLCKMLNQTPEAITELCKTLDWEIQDEQIPRLIIPKKPVPSKAEIATAEHQLAKLTEFVSFLEN